MPTWARYVVAIVGGWIVFVAAGALWSRVQDDQRRRRRPGEGRGSFVDSCPESIDAELAGTIYDIVACELRDDRLPLRWGDDLEHEYGIVDEDLDDVFRKALRRCGLPLDGLDVLPTDEHRIQSVQDLGMLVCRLRREMGPDASDAPADPQVP